MGLENDNGKGLLIKFQSTNLIAALVGGILGGVDGWFKGAYGFNGIATAILGALSCVVLAILLVNANSRIRYKACILGTVGACIGITLSFLQNKKLGYSLANGIDWLWLGIIISLSFQKAIYGAKLGSIIGFCIGGILGLLPGIKFGTGNFFVESRTVNGIVLSILACSFWGLILGAWLTASHNITSQTNKPHKKRRVIK